MPLRYKEPKWDNKKEIIVAINNDFFKRKAIEEIDEIPYVAEVKLLIKAKKQKKFIRFFPCLADQQRESLKRLVNERLNNIPEGVKDIKLTFFWNIDQISKIEEGIS